MEQGNRRERLREKLHALRWYLVVGSGTAFGALFLVIFGSAASANAQSAAQQQPEDPGAGAPAAQQPAYQQPAYQQPQVGSANPYYPPVVRTRRS